MSLALAQQDKKLGRKHENPKLQLFSAIKREIIERNRGGTKGMHGFIAEIAECGIGNARQQIEGNSPNYVWINDNGPVDIMRGTQEIQQKFVQSGGHLSLRAIIEHMRSYPDYLSNGGTYQIPQDHYERIKYYLSMPESVANKMPTSTGEFSLRQWKEVNELFASGNISISDIEPSVLSYGDAQADAIVGTFGREKEKLSETDQTQRDIAYQESKPSLAEGAKITAVSAAIEGATSLGNGTRPQEKSQGKRFGEFDTDDWLEVAGEASKGTVKGGVRG